VASFHKVECYLLSRSGGRSQGRREPARATREPLTACRRGGYPLVYPGAHFQSATAKRSSNCLELDRYLSFASVPRNRRIFPARLNLARHQPDEFGRASSLGKCPRVLTALADLGVEAFNGIGGVEDFSDPVRRQRTESPVPSCAASSARLPIFLSPWPAVEILEPLTSARGRFRPVNRFERRCHRPKFLPLWKKETIMI